MSFFGGLKKMADDAVSSVKSAFDRVANNEEMEAVVAAAVLVAACEGGISDQERESAVKGISSHESLQAFDKERIRLKFQEFAKLASSKSALAKEILIDKINLVKGATARVRVIGIVKEIAKADGTISEAESSMIETIRSAMK